jgi:FkbH-like protein
MEASRAADIVRTLLVSDFNIQTLANYLESSDERPPIDVTLGPFGQVQHALMDAALFDPVPHCTVVWTQPHRVVTGFRDLVEGHAVSRAEIDRQVADYADLLAAVAERTGLLIVPTWVLPPWQRGLGIGDFKGPQGLRSALAAANLVVADRLEPIAHAFVVDAARWHMLAGTHSFSPRLWLTGKIPFSSSVFAEAANDIRAALRAQRGFTRKLVIVDLDDTLWGGAVGDVGADGLHLGGHDHRGEAFVDLQRSLKALTRRGILLGIVSKNDAKVALDAISSHPEMVLRQEDFAGWRINWKDKAANILELASELRLGLESMVFLDSNPVERARVRDALPEVLVPELSNDPTGYNAVLHALDGFDVVALTTEDAMRGGMYAAERLRAAGLPEASDAEAWLAGLGTEVRVEPLNAQNRVRATQLLNKTNQMNLTTRRMTERELENWANEAGHRLWTFRVADRFGDAGLIGVASLVVADERAQFVDFVLSCRVIGRKIEETILAFVVQAARDAGATRLVAPYIRTEKNGPTLTFLERSGMQRHADEFSWPLGEPYPVPTGIKVAAR